MPFQIPGKEINKGEEKIFLSRTLTAWSVRDIFKIIADYCKENKAEIKKTIASSGFETSLKHWIKVGDNDGNIFIWLGKRDEENIDTNGAGELQISINRKDLERYSTGSYSRGGTIFWKDLNDQQLANELLKMRIEPFWSLINSGRKKGAISAYDDHEHNKQVIDRQKLGLNTNNFTNSEPNKGNYHLAIGLALGAGAVILGGVIVYFIQKRNKK